MADKQLTFGSLFSGCGGADLGLERAGLAVKWQVEIDDYCNKILDRHWRGVRRWSDARTFQPDASWRVDVLWASDPCQRNSGAGNNSKHESLGDHVVRVVDALRPRIVVRENPTHIRKDAPWPWWRMRSCFESLGYAVLPFRLRACCLGADHQRDRMFLLAELTDANSQRLEGREALPTKGRDIEPARLIPAADGLHLLAATGLRSRAGLTGYVDRIKAVGNSVFPNCAEWIGRRIIDSIAPHRLADHPSHSH